MSAGDAQNQHLDLDALADVLADGHEPGHLSTCPACQARLAELASALPGVVQVLAALPEPDPPADLEGRISADLAREAAPSPSNVLPMTRPKTRWLPALAGVAAVAVLVTGGVLLAQRGDSPSTTSSTTGGRGGYQVNTSGTDYTAASLPAALPGLLSGSVVAERASGADSSSPSPVPYDAVAPQQSPVKSDKALSSPADALAELRTTAGLARCLASLTDPSDAGLPLAVDYATFQGTPALVVVLPSSKADKVDVIVVPAGCAKADGQVLYFTRLPKP
jgi:hypothetical protein